MRTFWSDVKSLLGFETPQPTDVLHDQPLVVQPNNFPTIRALFSLEADVFDYIMQGWKTHKRPDQSLATGPSEFVADIVRAYRDAIPKKPKRQRKKSNDTITAQIASTNGTRKDRLLTVPEAAKLVGIGESTLYALCQHGKIRHYRFGKFIRVYENDALGYIRRMAKEAK